MKALTLALITALLLPAGAQEKKLDRQALRKKAAAVVKAEPADRPALLAELAAYDTLSSGDVKGWVGFLFSEIAKKPRYPGKSPATLNSAKSPMKYSVAGTTKQPAPLIIFLHGGGDPAIHDEQWEIALSKAQNMGFRVAVAPRVFDEECSWASDRTILAIAEIIDEVKRSVPIDTNQIYLGGGSMGGFGTSAVGPPLADRFAAIYSMAAATPGPGGFENLFQTPYALHVGGEDTPFGRRDGCRAIRDRLAELREKYKTRYEANFKEYPGVGHLLSEEAYADVGKWLKGFKRNPYPKAVVWKPTRQPLRHFYWLKVESFSANALVHARIEKDNRILVDAEGVEGLTLFLNDQLVNLKKPVTVVLNGVEKFSGKVEPSLTALIESIVAKEDPQMYFTARVVLE